MTDKTRELSAEDIVRVRKALDDADMPERNRLWYNSETGKIINLDTMEEIDV